MAEAPDPPTPPEVPRRWRLLWPLLLACWMVVAVCIWYVADHRGPPCLPRRPLPPPGVYDTVRAVEGPVLLRLDRLGLVRLAGLSAPADPAARSRLQNRLAALAPPGARVYVEPEPTAPPDPGAAASVEGGAAGDVTAASVFLPPPNAGADHPLPYAEASLIGATLVKEGLAPVHPQRGYRYRAEFRMLEHDARRHRRGLWAGR